MSVPYDPYRMPPRQPQAPRPAGTNGLAIASLVLGILWLCWIGSIVAIVTGFIALGQIRRTGQSGRGLAIAGIVLGVLGVLTGIVTGIVIALAGNELQKTESASIVLQGTGTGGAEQASVAYTTGSVDKIDAAVVPLPWEHRVTRELSGLDVVTVNVTNVGAAGTVTCRITVDGTVVATESASGGQAAATCTYNRIAN
ncbi:DUF4190 domain-containing protein [Spirillospora sp. NPDC047279]|uniref:DUF4190 domain-containing protein n=1 Tax=Spirillospora sp. NPDC047279 TaxID=3155478 RepID=UPI0033C29445